MPVLRGRDGAQVALVLFWHHLGAPQGAEWRSSSAGGVRELLLLCWKAFRPREMEGGEGEASSALSWMGKCAGGSRNTASVPGRHLGGNVIFECYSNRVCVSLLAAPDPMVKVPRFQHHKSLQC